MGRRKLDALSEISSLFLACFLVTGNSSFFFCWSVRLGDDCSSGAAGLHAAAMSGRWIHVDAWILGLWSRWLLLGARHLGYATDGWFALDSGILGMGQWCVRVARWLLGTAHRFLWRRELWLRLFRQRL